MINEKVIKYISIESVMDDIHSMVDDIDWDEDKMLEWAVKGYRKLHLPAKFVESVVKGSEDAVLAPVEVILPMSGKVPAFLISISTSSVVSLYSAQVPAVISIPTPLGMIEIPLLTIPRLLYNSERFLVSSYVLSKLSSIETIYLFLPIVLYISYVVICIIRI